MTFSFQYSPFSAFLCGFGVGKVETTINNMDEVLEIVVLLEEFPEGLILGDNTRLHTIVWFKKNSDRYEFINDQKPYILRRK